MGNGQSKWVIAHRGASGYLPENTLASLAMAHGLGCDLIEVDVILSQDGVPIVMHDLHLDRLTDVGQRFLGRSREDELHYALDFTLDELRLLRVHERLDFSGKPAYPNRFPPEFAHFSIPTLAEVIELIQGLNKSTGRQVKLLLEIKSPAWHREQGFDLTHQTLSVVQSYGFGKPESPVWLESFDVQEVRRLRYEFRTELRLLQLLGENSWQESAADYEHWKSAEGLRTLADYVEGVAVWTGHVLLGRRSSGAPRLTTLVKDAHALGLQVHTYTLRADTLPSYVPSFEEWLRMFYYEAGVDGVFTDFPDRANIFLKTMQYRHSM
jgi:glycerophosphoryl diester phosphodiesterase